MRNEFNLLGAARTAMLGGGLVLACVAQAGMVKDQHGNVGFDTAAECDAAVAKGDVRFYQSFTQQPPLKRTGEADVKTFKLNELVQAQQAAIALGYDAAGYAKGACDLGVGRSMGRDGVARELIGKYVPYSPVMPVNVYFDDKGVMVRATMQQCDNNFSRNMPRPVGVPAPASECFANVLIPARFETRTEQVIKVPATKRAEVVPATYKTVTEQELVKPETKRQIPIPATYKTVTEEVVVSPATFREEPVPGTFKTVTENVILKPASTKVEVVPATYKTVTEQVVATPERKELRVIPAVYAEKEETVVDRPATTRVETVPPTYKTETEQILVKAESLRYEPIVLPLRKVTEEVLRSEASANLTVSKPSLRTVTERVLVKEASKRLIEVPAVFETVTERVKVAEASREWKRGRAWIGQAINVRPLRGFIVGPNGMVDGSKVDVSAAAENRSKGVVDSSVATANNSNLDDDVMCLVQVPERYETITRQVLKTPATVREVEIPAEYKTITRQVLDNEASQRQVELPAAYQTVTRQVIDIDKLRAQGYKFDDKGDIVETPKGERVLRAANVAGLANAANTSGAESGQEGYVREIKIPAEYRTLTRQVVVTPASVRTVEVPATYKTVKTKVVTSPARTEEVVIPATYKTVTSQVVATPATSREISIPAEMGVVRRQVQDTPPTTRKIPVPEVKEAISRRVVDTPASLREETIPAVYKTVTRKVIDTPASTREVEVPAQYETLKYQVQVSEAKADRRAVLCETNASPSKIVEIQRALLAAGFNPGPIDGVLRARTMTAVNQYQQAKGLPVDGFLNLDTVKALGVSPN
jgi:hypothetical protein